MRKTKYRIATDNISGYEVQYREWWMLFWASNWRSFKTVDEAKEFAKELQVRESKKPFKSEVICEV